MKTHSKSSGISSTRPWMLYLMLFAVIAFFLGLLHWLLNWSGHLKLQIGHDIWSGVIQATIGIAVAFAGALVALKIALSAESLARQGERREQFQEMRTFLTDTQSHFRVLGNEVRSLFHSCNLQQELLLHIEDFGLERLIRQPDYGYTAFDTGLEERMFNRVNYGYATIEEDVYKSRLASIAELGAKATEDFDENGEHSNWIVNEHAQHLSLRLKRETDFPQVSIDLCRLQLRKIAQQMQSTAEALEKILTQFDCLSVCLPGYPEGDSLAIQKVECAISILRFSANHLNKSNPLLTLGKAFYVADSFECDFEGDKEDEIDRQDKALVLMCILISNPSPFPGAGNYTDIKKGLVVIEAILKLLPGENEYFRHFSRLWDRLDLTKSNAALEVSSIFPAMKYLGARTHLGQSLIEATMKIEKMNFPHKYIKSQEHEFFNGDLIEKYRDLEPEDKILNRSVGYWLGNRHADYLLRIKNLAAK